ncbi:Hypothetical protein HVR_LOCUS918 [uncultured virus]|nr:Hypothetical protein HVR_LOCUS918 [uncultured virus]
MWLVYILLLSCIIYGSQARNQAQYFRVSTREVITFVPLCKPYLNFTHTKIIQGPSEWIMKSFIFSQVQTATLKSTFLHEKCQEHLLAFTCLSAFQPYNKNTALCSSFCNITAEICNLPLSCDQRSRLESNCVGLHTCGNITINCYSPKKLAAIPKFPFPQCGGVLAPDDSISPKEGIPCGLKCPPPDLITDSTIEAIDWTLRISLPIAEFLLFILLIVQIWQREYWLRFPLLYIFYCTITILLAQTAFLLVPIAGGYRNFSCSNATHSHNGDDVLCNMQTWIIFTAAWMQMFLFLIITLNIFLMIEFPIIIKRYLSNIQRIYHGILFIPPLIILIVTQSTGNLGYNYGSSLCFFKKIKLSALPNVILLFTLITPFTVCILVGFILIGIILIKVYRKGNWRSLLKQWRLGSFVTLYGCFLLLALVPLYNQIINEDTIQSNAAEYYTCRTMNWIASLFREERSPCDKSTMKTIPMFFYWHINGFVPIITGFLLILFFGKDCRRFYRKSKMTTSLRTSSSRSGSDSPRNRNCIPLRTMSIQSNSQPVI